MAAAFGVAAPAAHAALAVPSQSFATLSQFEAAAGGADNGTTPGEQGSGFRHWTPAGTPVNGSDPGSTAIPGGHTAALSPSRLQPWGMEIGPEVAVANDGFQSVNSNAAFNPPDLWAPFNSNTATFQFVAPGSPTPAVTKGLGVTFVHVENSGTTIQYYSGNTLVGQVTAAQGSTSFAGMLFSSPVVTRVVITLGTAEIFGFDGSTVSQGGTTSSTLAAGDDVVAAEPGAGQTTAATTAGMPLSSELASFDSGEAPGDITATVDWGDGTSSAGTIVPQGAGAFTVTGSHSYGLPGGYRAHVTVQDFSGAQLVTQALFAVGQRSTSASVSCSPADVAVSATASCTATVSDTSAGSPTTPTGVVTFSSPTAAASFPGAGACILGPTAVAGTSICVVQFEPGQLPPTRATLIAAYGGDTVHGASSATTVLGVHKEHCSVTALSHRLRSGGFGVLVTCEAKANVQIAAQAKVNRKGRFRSFQLAFGSVQSAVSAGRPTVLVIKPAAGAIRTLRSALQHHQRVSLKLTLTASSHATRTTTTKRVSAIRFP